MEQKEQKKQKEQKEQKEQKDTLKVAKEPSLYADIGGFKGFSFQSNIDSINKLYFGQGLVISKAPYIYRNEKDGKYYLSAYCFKIVVGEKSKEIYYPEAFLNLVFYHNKKIYFVNSQNELSVYKIDETSCKKYKFPPKYLNKKETNPEPSKGIKEISVDLNAVRLKQISEKLTQLSQNADVKSEYEFLCDVVKNDFKESLMDKSKQIKETISYIIKKDDMNFICEISKDSKEIDSVGNWRKQISVNEGEISFQAGMQSLMKYVELGKNDDAIKDIIANDFKCPVLFKNFKEKIIPENKTLMCEIKAGFAVKDVVDQIEKRIKFIKNCLFNKGEKPEYFIGIVNLFSEGVQKLSEFDNYEPIFEGNVILLSVVDYEYHGLNISYEINNDFLLLNEINKLHNDNAELKQEMKKLNNNFKELNSKLDRLLGKYDGPGFNNQESSLSQKQPFEEEKKNDFV